LDDGARHTPVAYRADIDGLRAIAVIAVVLFHAKLPFLTGGYVGVDVFFVISGFLITAILLQDHSISRFYKRRAQRILPALSVLIAAVLAVGVAILLPHDLVKMAKSAVATVLFGSNIWFWRQSGYFAVETELWPLLHTWSLGVEEQFYLAFPLLVKLVHRWRRGHLAILFGVLALGSLASAVFAIAHVKGVLAFYLAPPRAWELLAGAMLATGALHLPRAPWLRAAVAAAGLGLIGWPIVAWSPQTVFPGWGAVPPVLGAMLVIWAGQGGAHPLSPIIGCRPAQGIGLISYSLYLWHWPVLAFGRYVAVRELTATETVLAIVVMAVLAWLSWRFVERPFRGRMADRWVWTLSAGSIAVLLAASAAVIAGGGWPARFPPAVVALNAEEGETWRCPVTQLTLFGDFYACPLGRGTTAGNADVVLWGDSHAQMYVPAFGDRRVLLVNANGCAPVLGDAAEANCGAIQRGNYARIVRLPARTVVLAQNWPQYRDEASARLGRLLRQEERYGDAIRRLEALVRGLRAHGKRVVVIGPVPLPGYTIASVAARDLAFRGRITTPTGIARTAYLAEYAWVLNAMARMARDPGVRVARVDRWVCRDDRCPFVAEGRAAFADYGHYATWYAARMKPGFDRLLDERLEARPE
jgi:peptidoglycan/LPS O-acetylase OafA/YrhL